ncbi:MAG: DUF2508 family protein [Acetivibrionales bacterium]
MELNRNRNQHIGLENSSQLARIVKSMFLKKKAGSCLYCNSSEAAELVEIAREAHQEWVDANRGFEYAGDEAIVDYYTYKIKACEVRYQHFLKKAKEMGIKLEVFPHSDIYPITQKEGISIR